MKRERERRSVMYLRADEGQWKSSGGEQADGTSNFKSFDEEKGLRNTAILHN